MLEKSLLQALFEQIRPDEFRLSTEGYIAITTRLYSKGYSSGWKRRPKGDHTTNRGGIRDTISDRTHKAQSS